MNSGWWIRFAALGAAILALAACDPSSAPPDADDPQNTYTIYLVRHAEKEAEGSDPALTEAGTARAEALADLLEGEGIEAVWSSDYVRTRSTAKPLADRLGADVQTYDPSDLPGFAQTLESRGETALVVGHSNTTPALSALLGGEPGNEIDEAGEYDRLYVLSGVGSGAVETDIRRYGVRYDASGG